MQRMLPIFGAIAMAACCIGFNSVRYPRIWEAVRATTVTSDYSDIAAGQVKNAYSDNLVSNPITAKPQPASPQNAATSSSPSREPTGASSSLLHNSTAQENANEVSIADRTREVTATPISLPAKEPPPAPTTIPISVAPSDSVGSNENGEAVDRPMTPVTLDASTEAARLRDSVGGEIRRLPPVDPNVSPVVEQYNAGNGEGGTPFYPSTGR